MAWSANRCTNVAIGALFDDPYPYLDKRICTSGYISQNGTLYPEFPPRDPHDVALDIASFKKDADLDRLQSAPDGAAVEVTGRLTVFEDCWAVEAAGITVDPCVPIRRPMFLDYATITSIGER